MLLRRHPDRVSVLNRGISFLTASSVAVAVLGVAVLGAAILSISTEISII